jgi:hypothetical protein
MTFSYDQKRGVEPVALLPAMARTLAAGDAKIETAQHVQCRQKSVPITQRITCSSTLQIALQNQKLMVISIVNRLLTGPSAPSKCHHKGMSGQLIWHRSKPLWHRSKPRDGEEKHNL